MKTVKVLHDRVLNTLWLCLLDLRWESNLGSGPSGVGPRLGASVGVGFSRLGVSWRLNIGTLIHEQRYSVTQNFTKQCVVTTPLLTDYVIDISGFHDTWKHPVFVFVYRSNRLVEKTLSFVLNVSILCHINKNVLYNNQTWFVGVLSIIKEIKCLLLV